MLGLSVIRTEGFGRKIGKRWRKSPSSSCILLPFLTPFFSLFLYKIRTEIVGWGLQRILGNHVFSFLPFLPLFFSLFLCKIRIKIVECGSQRILGNYKSKEEGQRISQLGDTRIFGGAMASASPPSSAPAWREMRELEGKWERREKEREMRNERHELGSFGMGGIVYVGKESFKVSLFRLIENWDKYKGYLVFLGEIGIFSCGNPS